MYQLVSHRVTLTVVLMLLTTSCAGATDAHDECANWKETRQEWIWCDDFENRTPLEASYFDFDGDDGDLARVEGEAAHGMSSLRGKWQAHEDDAGHFMRTFGRNPVGSQSHSSENFSEVYWRFYFKLQDGFEGRPDKFTRAFIFASPDWAQAMIAHVWLDEEWRRKLLLDPATGINRDGELAATKWNDFDNLRWLGNKKGSTTLEPGKWYCLEIHLQLNSPGDANGVLEFWLDDELEARRGDLNFVGPWKEYGINTISFENYWNSGSPKEQERYFDALVISRNRIGCLSKSDSNG